MVSEQSSSPRAIGSSDLNVWSYSESLALPHLAERVVRVSAHLKKSAVDIRGGAVSGNYVRSLKEETDEGNSRFFLQRHFRRF